MMPATSEQRLTLTRPEAARALGCSTRTLDRLISFGAIRSIRLLRRRVVPVADLRRLVERGGCTIPQHTGSSATQ